MNTMQTITYPLNAQYRISAMNTMHIITYSQNTTFVIYHQCTNMEGLWLLGSIKLQVSFAKEPYKTDNILQKRPLI